MFAEGERRQPELAAVLAANLRRERIARRLSLSQLARATELGKATISQIEAQKANPTVETLRLLAAALGVTVGQLLEDPDRDDVRVVRRPRGRGAAEGRRYIDRFRAQGAVEVHELCLPAGHQEELTPGPPGAREEMVVIQGSVVAGPVGRPTELRPGDWASFPADVARQLVVGRNALRVIILAHA